MARAPRGHERLDTQEPLSGGGGRPSSADTDDRKALAPATVGLVHNVVATVFRAAVRDRTEAETPRVGIRLPDVEKPRVAPLTTERVDALEDAMPPELRALVGLAAGTGSRQVEVLGLTRDHLRLLSKIPR